jgi:hypothetical protein
VRAGDLSPETARPIDVLRKRQEFQSEKLFFFFDMASLFDARTKPDAGTSCSAIPNKETSLVECTNHEEMIVPENEDLATAKCYYVISSSQLDWVGRKM